MKKKVLIAVDDSLHAAHAVAYAVRLSTIIPEMHFDLLNIHPAVSGYLLDEAERSARARSELERLVRKNQQASQTLLEKYQDQMTRSGVAAERLNLQSRPRHIAVADDLLALSQAASYDAVLVGRRGVSALQELFTGSVTANLVGNTSLVPVWIVDGTVTDTSILLAVDGSPASLRALDHLAFLLGGECRSRLNLLHVQPRLQDFCALDPADQAGPAAEAVVLDADQRCIDDFFSQAKTILSRCGISEDRLEFKTVAGGLLTARAILDETRRGGYGTLVLGRSGTTQSRFFGSVSAKVLQKAQDMAVWIVP